MEYCGIQTIYMSLRNQIWQYITANEQNNRINEKNPTETQHISETGNESNLITG